jgi:Fe-coproporphyrin III synthase
MQLREAVVGAEAPLKTALRTVPILIFNVHSHCNCRCVMCDIWKRATLQQIDVAGLERHRASLRNLGVRQVVFSGGEPLLHTNLAPLCRFFLEQGIRLTLLTTGLLLCKRAAEVARNFDEVIVSIDGPPGVHDAIRRVPGAFALISKGIAALRGLRPDMRITCRTTVQKSNHRQLCATAEATRHAGFDAISFLAADLTSQAFNRSLVWPGERQSEIALTQEEIAALEAEIEAMLLRDAEEGRPRFILESREKLARIARHFRAHIGLATPVPPVCNAPWVSAVIETDGSLRPCFFHRPVGNVAETALQDVINGEEAQRFRQGLDVASNPTCRRCVCSLHLPARVAQGDEL